MAVGDEVFGVAPGCLGPSVVVPEQLMVAKPPMLSFEEAATTPTVYVTVYTAFGDLENFNPNTKVGILLHLLLPSLLYQDKGLLLYSSGAKSWSLDDGKHWIYIVLPKACA